MLIVPKISVTVTCDFCKTAKVVEVPINEINPEKILNALNEKRLYWKVLENERECFYFCGDYCMEEYEGKND